jgi:RHS repeat-associated protein
MFDDQGQILFSKVFSYEGDNVKEEVLTENAGEESYRKTYSYYADNLVKTEQEENGLNYEYFYKPNTDLLIAKFTKDQEGHVLIREFRFYDEDNLLVHEITDNGVSIEPNDIRNVTQRLQKYTERDAASGLPITITESYWDPISGVQKLLKRTKFTYINHKVSTEAVFDAQDVHRYTIETEYDHFGNVKRQTTPLGQENTYLYNDLCNLAQVKEVGSSSKIYEYDRANRQVSCLEVDTGKTVRNTYSAKSLILSETDERGNITVHSYDLLGNRRSTTFPKAIDENGLIYEPTMTFGYDVQGNLTSSTTPRNETTQTFYNALRKPIRIIQADGSEIRHFYDRNGALSKTMHPDETEEHYGYDLFQRMTSKIIYNSTHEVLSHESWSYDAFQLRSYTDPRGLVTKFSYDGAGRKISEEAEDRTIIYAYDSLGFLERTNNGAIISVQKHNAAGLIEEQWTEDASGRIENRMQFSYNSENQKIKAIRFTSQGEARDLFTYADGKLVSHTDPLRAVTKFIYDESFINRLGQNVLRKMTIDPLNNQTIETYDAGGRLVCKEKKDPQGLTVSKEERFYDRSGNCAKRLSYVYVEGAISKQIEVRWEYDAIGRVTKEMEAGKKTTLFYYDKRGFLSARILPSGVRISSVYDGIGRLLEEYSSDGTMNNQYIYANSPDPIQIIDHVQKTMIKRSYNRFGDLIKEVNMNDFQMRWQYDSIGRCISMILPDASSIDYAYLGAHLRAVQRKSTYGHLLYEHQYNQFDPNGHVAEEQLIFGLGSIVTTHDLLERPSNQCSSWLEHSIGYGPSGLVTATYNSLFGKKTYQHDALNQLIMEGEQTYCFDSLGNPAAYEINDLNQIVATQDCRLVHDENGNLYEKVYAHKHVRYSFDSCSRLSKITVPKQKKIIYSYDPLSRLSSKEIYQYSEDVWTQESKIFYLYNQEQEIGTLDENGKLIELKVLGLGIKGDIGAAIAIELGNQVYAPLHNFSGNVIALLSSDGQVAESYEIDAFGKETSSSTPLNPWRFCSKRSEEGFVFFGLRFYDPSLGRWLSPDPSGFSDGPNLYAYVQNSPLNRLDLFGLFSEDPFQMPEIQFNIPILSLANSQLLQCKVLEGGVYTDYIVSCGHWHQLSFTPHELESGSCNLLDHPELGGADGRISLVTYRHGINTTYSEFSDTCTSIVQRFPGTLFIGRYHGTEGLVKDSVNTAKEFCNIETVEICKTLQWELSCSQFVQKINPVVFNSSGEVQSGDLWMHLTHSRGGLIDFKALQNMPYEQKRILQYQLLLTAIAPAHLIPRNFGLEVMNIYSSQDFFTGPLGMPEVLAPLFGITGHLIAKYAFDRSDYNIKIVPCVSKWGERSFGVADHAILGGTYREVISNSIDSNKKIYGFYDGKTR